MSKKMMTIPRLIISGLVIIIVCLGNENTKDRNRKNAIKSSQVDEQIFSPPEWILGTWADPFGDNGYIFEKSNFDYYNLKTGKAITNLSQTYSRSSIDEKKESDSYIVTLRSKGQNFDMTIKYSFKKISKNELLFTFDSDRGSSPALKMKKVK